MENIDERLRKAQLQIRRRKKLESMYRRTEKLLHESNDKLQQLKAELASEERDVHRLERVGLASLFYAILGTKEERLKQERLEHLNTRLRHDDADDALIELNNQLRRIRELVGKLDGADQDFAQALREKEQSLADSKDPRSQPLHEIAMQITAMDAEEKELREAISAGEAAQLALNEVESRINSALNWGRWDMFAGGTVTTFIKHSRIDSARSAASKAQICIVQFREELDDVGSDLNASLEIGSMSRFLDFFFDGLIVDWMVQSRIYEAQSACIRALDAVKAAMRPCSTKMLLIRGDRERLIQRREEILLTDVPTS